MTALNFSHPLTETQHAHLEALAGEPVRVVAVVTQFNNARPFFEQGEALLGAIPLSPENWQSEPLILILPGHSVIAALILAAVHGRCGYFPSVVRLRPIEGAPVPQFEIAELIPLQNIRDSQRKERHR